MKYFKIDTRIDSKFKKYQILLKLDLNIDTLIFETIKTSATTGLTWLTDHSKQQWTINNNFTRRIRVRGFFLHFSSIFYEVWCSNQIIICFCIIKIKFWISDIWPKFACQFPLQNGKSILWLNLLERVLHKMSLIWILAWKRLEVFSAGKSPWICSTYSNWRKNSAFLSSKSWLEARHGVGQLFRKPRTLLQRTQDFCRQKKVGSCLQQIQR